MTGKWRMAFLGLKMAFFLLLALGVKRWIGERAADCNWLRGKALARLLVG
jgi:hypothetical protein